VRPLREPDHLFDLFLKIGFKVCISLWNYYWGAHSFFGFRIAHSLILSNKECE